VAGQAPVFCALEIGNRYAHTSARPAVRPGREPPQQARYLMDLDNHITTFRFLIREDPANN
jgi:hypothetical protein